MDSKSGQLVSKKLKESPSAIAGLSCASETLKYEIISIKTQDNPNEKELEQL